MTLRSQSEHEALNRREYPGTRQLCDWCGDPTGRCEDDSIFLEAGRGPLCSPCLRKWEDEEDKEDEEDDPANAGIERPMKPRKEGSNE